MTWRTQTKEEQGFPMLLYVDNTHRFIVFLSFLNSHFFHCMGCFTKVWWTTNSDNNTTSSVHRSCWLCSESNHAATVTERSWIISSILWHLIKYMDGQSWWPTNYEIHFILLRLCKLGKYLYFKFMTESTTFIMIKKLVELNCWNSWQR